MTPGQGAVGLAGLVIIGLALLFLLGGCVHVVQEPGLPFPTMPTITWFRCGPALEYQCLTEADANALNRWAKKVRAFEAAREELLK